MNFRSLTWLLAAMLVAGAVGAQATHKDGHMGDHAEDDHDHADEGMDHNATLFKLKGEFVDNVSDAELDDFNSTVSAHDAEYEFDNEEFEAKLAEEPCQELHTTLSNKSYIDSVSECEASDDHRHDDTPKDKKSKADREHPKGKSPQGMALGRDSEWKQCKADAGDNETLKKECHDAAKERARERHDAIKAAREAGRIGGSVNVTRDGAANVTMENGVMIDVEVPEAQGEELRVVVDADLERGQTITLDVSPDMFDENGDLLIAYYDISDDGVETLNESFAEASSLEDVLNPDDDDGPEYWLEEDAEGLHVLVSIPEWSVHAISMSQFQTAESAEAPAAGLLIGLSGLASAMALRRR